jgi:hypothetical protein
MPDPFHVRFNIEVPSEEARRRLINRIENKVRNIASALLEAVGHISNPLEALIIEVETAVGERDVNQVSGSGS